LRLIARSMLAAILVAGMLDLPAMAAAGRPVGMVVNAESARLGEANAAMGADVFAGDALQTDPGGTLRLKLGSTQLYLGSASAATLGQQENRLQVRLVRGMLGFSSAAGDQFQVETPIGIVRSADGQRAFGEVTITGPQSILVASYHGALLLSGSGGERTITEGDAYNVSLAPDPNPAATPASPGPAPAPPVSGLQNHYVFDAVVIGAAAGAAAAFWVVFGNSDYHTHPAPPR
jgi:ferric-dicitrate binding protein FerR (iron transport regulator)